MRARRLPHLVLAWYWKEPARAGEVAVVAEARVLGRGGPPGEGLEWVRQRPGKNLPRPFLDDRRISRRQLRLEPVEDGLAVVNLGRCELMHNGMATERAHVRPGDLLSLRDVAVFLFEWRLEALPSCVHYDADHIDFEFGSADRHGMLGESEAAWRLRDQLAGTAASEGHVLIVGASGVGKELAAHAVHALSSRARRSKISRNAATIPEALIDAELFGNARNYPNPGTPERVGLIGEADGGTLVLDEIGELPPTHQAHLLRVLDRAGEYHRLGESRERRSNFRMIGLTNRPLSALKEDFLARFPLRVEVPDLNQRRADVTLALRASYRALLKSEPALARRFRMGPTRPEPLVEPRLIEALVRQHYRHNYRQLFRLLRLALFDSDGDYVAWTEAVDADGKAPSRESPDRHAVQAALEQSHGRPTEAARQLGLRNRFALYRLMDRHGISRTALPNAGSSRAGKRSDAAH